MNYQKSFYLITTITFLLITLLGAISFRFLNNQWQKSQQVDPEILAQYTISLEVQQFLDLVKKLKK